MEGLLAEESFLYKLLQRTERPGSHRRHGSKGNPP